MNKNLVAGALALAAIGGTSLYLNNAPTRSEKVISEDTDYSVERSYEEYGDKDCADFVSQSEAQDFFEDQGGPSQDAHGLYRDQDGVACESLK